MDLSLTQEQKMLQTMARDFAREVLEPRADELDETGEFPMDIFKRMADLGFTAMTIPAEYGGGGSDMLSYAIVVEELSRGCTPVAGALNTHTGCAETICRYGTAEQKQKFLPRLISGETIGAFSVTEAEAGSDISRIETTATLEGDTYVLNGTKIFVTNGSVAGLGVVFCDVKRLSPRGMTAFIVEKGAPGFTIGKKYRKVGMRAMDNCDFVFENCRIPASNRLGDEGRGMKINLETIDYGRIGVAAQAMGIVQAILDHCVEYSKQRVQFGGPISQNQAISFKIADIATGLEAARALNYRAAYLADTGQPFRKEASMAKLFASELCMKAAVEGIQIHGGYGYMMDMPLQRYFRDAKILEIYEGTSEIQRMVISGNLLR